MKKIIVPVDGSPASEKAAEKAIEIAKIYGSEITFITIVDARYIYTYDVGGIVSLPFDYPQITTGLIELQTKILDAFTDKLNLNGINIEKLVLHGVAYEEILKYAKKINCDLIVMGRRGFSKVKRFFVGSVTQRVISDAPCPVLIINEKEEK
ncbi:MAG: universal stress protein [Sedimentibacter sp.]